MSSLDINIPGLGCCSGADCLTRLVPAWVLAYPAPARPETGINVSGGKVPSQDSRWSPLPRAKAPATKSDLRPIKTELLPEAVTDGRTKINVPLFNRFMHRPSSVKLSPTPQRSIPTPAPPPPFFYILGRISVFTAGGCAPLLLFLGLFFFFLAVSKSKRLAHFPLGRSHLFR